jgi:hypothetical protein
VLNNTSHINPDNPDRNPETTVNVRGVIECNDQPASPVEKV